MKMVSHTRKRRAIPQRNSLKARALPGQPMPIGQCRVGRMANPPGLMSRRIGEGPLGGALKPLKRTIPGSFPIAVVLNCLGKYLDRLQPVQDLRPF